MRHAWLLDVLTDLRGFAREEGFDRLAAKFDDALAVAAGELDRADGVGAGLRPSDLFEPGCGQRTRH